MGLRWATTVCTIYILLLISSFLLSISLAQPLNKKKGETAQGGKVRNAVHRYEAAQAVAVGNNPTKIERLPEHSSEATIGRGVARVPVNPTVISIALFFLSNLGNQSTVILSFYVVLLHIQHTTVPSLFLSLL